MLFINVVLVIFFDVMFSVFRGGFLRLGDGGGKFEFDLLIG